MKYFILFARFCFSCVLLYLIYQETGWATTGAFALIMIHIEISNRSMILVTDSLARLAGLMK